MFHLHFPLSASRSRVMFEGNGRHWQIGARYRIRHYPGKGAEPSRRNCRLNMKCIRSTLNREIRELVGKVSLRTRPKISQSLRGPRRDENRLNHWPFCLIFRQIVTFTTRSRPNTLDIGNSTGDRKPLGGQGSNRYSSLACGVAYGRLPPPHCSGSFKTERQYPCGTSRRI